jgi:hypothetical protein
MVLNAERGVAKSTLSVVGIIRAEELERDRDLANSKESTTRDVAAWTVLVRVWGDWGLPLRRGVLELECDLPSLLLVFAIACSCWRLRPRDWFGRCDGGCGCRGGGALLGLWLCGWLFGGMDLGCHGCCHCWTEDVGFMSYGPCTLYATNAALLSRHQLERSN